MKKKNGNGVNDAQHGDDIVTLTPPGSNLTIAPDLSSVLQQIDDHRNADEKLLLTTIENEEERQTAAQRVVNDAMSNIETMRERLVIINPDKYAEAVAHGVVARQKVLGKMSKVSTKIASKTPSPGGEMTLREAVINVMNGNPATISELLTGVNQIGYKSKSANLRGLINQVLAKSDQFVKVARATYRAKVGASRAVAKAGAVRVVGQPNVVKKKDGVSDTLFVLNILKRIGGALSNSEVAAAVLKVRPNMDRKKIDSALQALRGRMVDGKQASSTARVSIGGVPRAYTYRAVV